MYIYDYIYIYIYGRLAKQWVKELVEPSTELISQYVAPRPVGHRQDPDRTSDSIQTDRIQTDTSKRAPRCMGTRFLQKGRAPRCMGALGKTENERHAAWERLRGPEGPDGSPKTGAPKISQTVILKQFLTFFKAPLEHPRRAHTKRDHPKWTPKSSQGNRTKHSFSGHIL